MTNKEILQTIKELRDCASGEAEDCPFTAVAGCDGCPKVSADLIEHLTAENADLRKEIEWKDMVVALAQRKRVEAEAERDAAIVDLKIFAGCSACRHCCDHRRDHQESLLLTCCDCTKKQNCKCGSCSLGRSNWEWRGLQEAPEEGGKA